MRKKKKRNSKVRTFPNDRKPKKRQFLNAKMFYETKLSKWQIGKLNGWSLKDQQAILKMLKRIYFEDEHKETW